jgi:putative ABC transport system permease protein
MILIFSTLTILHQVSFMQDKDLGYDQSHVLVCGLPQSLAAEYQSLKTDLLRHPQILHVTACMNLPTWQGPSFGMTDWEGHDSDRWITMYHGSVDYDFFKTLGMDMKQGRAFSRDFATDGESAVIINEEAVVAMGMSEPIGKRMNYLDGPRTIIGVVKNFHFATLRSRIQPLALVLAPQHAAYVLIKIDPTDPGAAAAWVEKTWHGHDPENTIEIQPLEDILARVYVRERLMRSFFSYAAYLSLFISCLGLLGLAAYAVEQRGKEIGIRKVMGATGPNIFILLSGEHVKLVALAVCIAWPVGYTAMSRFLQGYPYRTSIGIETFLLSALSAFAFAFLTIFSLSLKAARIEPAEMLKYE